LAKNNEFLAGHAFDISFGVFFKKKFNPRELVVICQKWFSDLLITSSYEIKEPA
jgi:hypothetical protein